MHSHHSTTSSRLVVAVLACLTLLTLLLPLVGAEQSSAASGALRASHSRLLARAGFERSIAGWKAVNANTKLTRVRGGNGGSRHAAAITAPASGAATVGVTDRPDLVTSTRRGQVYAARVWLKPGKDALRRGTVVGRIGAVENSSNGRRAQAWRRVRLQNSHWHSVTVFLTARGDGHRLDVSIRAFDVPAGKSVRVDNVTIRKVSRPHVPSSQLHGTRFGASVDDVSGDWTKALHKSDRRYGRMDTVRVFDPGLPSGWSGRLGDTKRPLVYSFDARPSAVLAGIYDHAIRQWFRAAPKRWPIWWSYIHEPEDNIARGEFTASRYRAAWRHVYQLSQAAHNHQLHPTLILMCWTLSPNSGRTFSDYYPGDFIKVLSWDCYNSASVATSYKAPSAIFGRAVAKTRALGKGFGVAEFGSRLVPGDDGSRRAMWLADVARYTAKHHARFVTYWDANIPAGSFKLRDLPSSRSWRSVVSAR